jgi:hypothetical protein
MKKVLIVSDFHSGHLCGLTPPKWQIQPEDESPTNKLEKFAASQRECWNWFEKTTKQLGPWDVVIANGDLIDGSGHRSGGTEQLTTDRLKQAAMAVHILKSLSGPKTEIIQTVGTSYHTGDAEDFETVIAEKCGARKIGSHEWVEIEGVIFDVKHHCGSSSVPHGRHTAIARERLWNLLWNERGMSPKSDVIVRSHVHYFSVAGGVDWLAMTTPALQSHGSKYGARRCSGIVDYGFVWFTVNKGSYSWRAEIADLPALRSGVIKL